MNKRSNWIVVLLVATGIAASGFTNFKNAWESKKWPVTKGVVISSQLERNSNRKKVNGNYVLVTTFNAKITYTYQVSSIAYTSSRITFADPKTMSHEQAVCFTTILYPLGKEVEVYFNPKEPNTCALVPGLTINSSLPFMVSLIPLLISIIYYLIKRKKNISL
jgi:hypothetical protein